jgi:hypothetical protein
VFYYFFPFFLFSFFSPLTPPAPVSPRRAKGGTACGRVSKAGEFGRILGVSLSLANSSEQSVPAIWSSVPADGTTILNCSHQYKNGHFENSIKIATSNHQYP